MRRGCKLAIVPPKFLVLSRELFLLCNDLEVFFPPLKKFLMESRVEDVEGSCCIGGWESGNKLKGI